MGKASTGSRLCRARDTRGTGVGLAGDTRRIRGTGPLTDGREEGTEEKSLAGRDAQP